MKIPTFSTRREPLAIIGIGCRFPDQSENPEDFFHALIDKKDCIRDIPNDRWDFKSLYHPDYKVAGKINVHQGGFIDKIDMFDAQFFGISPIEAMRMDPQQRLLLENSYMAIEDAGLKLEDLSGTRTGVFIGLSSHDYGDLQHAYAERVNLGAHTMQGGASSIAANRISYAFNFQGPSFTVDTACSSSLVAAHLASRSLWSGESTLAIVGAANAILKPESEMGFSKGGFLSPDQRCMAFDARANGYIRSEGAAVIILKPLSKAIEHNDDIYALIIGSALNEDGRTGGLAMPNLDAQISALKDAYRDAGIDPNWVTYVEAHGTGTAVGDPTECQSLGSIIGKCKEKPLIVGSVKSNIGHLEPASGMAGLVKLVLSLKKRVIPPNIHFKTPNPKIDFKGWNLEVPTQKICLPLNDTIYAGINSFGFGGANAHMVLMSLPEQKTKVPKQGERFSLFTLSARSEDALKKLAVRYADYLEKTNENLENICFTAATRRSGHEVRLSAVTSSKSVLAGHLKAYNNNENPVGISVERVVSAGESSVAFVYTGQGPQWFAMGRELLKSNLVFQKTIDKIDTILSKLGWLKEAHSSLKEELLKEESKSRIHETEIAQPAIFALQVALTEVWSSLGIKPKAVVGHSIGELAASWAANILSLEEATRIVFWRSRCQAKAKGAGRMLAVGLSETKTKEKLNGLDNLIDIAAINGPNMVTLAGDTKALENFSEDMDKKGIFNRFLVVDVPFHSYLLDSIEDVFLTSVGRIDAKNSNLKYYSTVTETRLNGAEMDAAYWFKNIRNEVRYYPTLKQMINDGHNIFVEIGPHPILSGGVKDSFTELKVKGCVVPSLRRKEPEYPRLLLSIGELFNWGFKVDWQKLFDPSCIKVKLPHYAWQRESYWLEKEQSKKARIGKTIHPHILSYSKSAKEPDNFSYDINLDKRIHPYIKDHRVQGPIVYPGAGHVDLSISAALASFGKNFGFLEEINFKSALFLTEKGDPYHVRLEISSDEGEFVISSKKNGDDSVWVSHSHGKINHVGDKFVSNKVDLETIQKRITVSVSIENLFQDLSDGGLKLGSAFKGLTRLYQGDGESLGYIKVPDELKYEYGDFHIHPAILDACFQTVFGIFKRSPGEKMGVYIPIHIDRVKFYKKPEGYAVWSYAKSRIFDGHNIKSNLWIFDDKRNLVAELQGFVCQYLQGSKGEVAQEKDSWFYEYIWKRKIRRSEELYRRPEKYLPSPLTVKSRMSEFVQKIIAQPNHLNYLDNFEPLLNKLTISYILDAFESMGTSFFRGFRFDSDQLFKKCSVLEKHKRFFNHLILILARYGFIKKNQQVWEVAKVRSGMKTAPLQEHLEQNYPEFHLELSLLKRCASYIKEVMQGDIDPITLIFPENQWDSIIDYYARAHAFKKYNEIVYTSLKTMAETLPKDSFIRILEIGAGTGGVTQAVFSSFPADSIEYTFTDISEIFLAKARRRFANYPFMKYCILDIENDIEKQGFDPHSFDIVIASNVIHATKNVMETLKNIQRLLAPKGIFSMLEVTKTPIDIDLIFGMTEGWWLYQDLDVRPNHCTMLLKNWLPLLKKLGFTDIVPITDVEDGERSSQTVFLMRNKDEILLEESGETRTKKAANWIIFSDKKGFGKQVAEKLARHRKTCYLVETGGSFSRKAKGLFEINPKDKSDFKKLLEEFKGDDIPLEGVVHCWSLDAAESDDMTNEALETAFVLGAFSVLNTIGTISRQTNEQLPHIWILTSGAQVVEADQVGKVCISQSGVWGLARTAINEYPNLPISLIDLSYHPSQEELDELVKELMEAKGEYREEELAFRGKQRYLHSFENVNTEQTKLKAKKNIPASGYPYHLTTTETGSIEGLVLREYPSKPLKDEEVQIDVLASSLNFRDVMLATGFLDEEAIRGGIFEKSLGLECAGKVSAIGKNVTGFKIGDDVFAIASNSLGGIATARQDYTLLKPSHLTFAEASTLLVAYLTAYYSLQHLARMEKNESILVHAGAGGVGIAAIKLALSTGCTVYATASKNKWDYLKKLGVKEVFNSRSLDFKGKLLSATHGKGVDIVINSLSGKMITQSIKCLAPYGRFIEIGKNDIYLNKRIGLKPFGNNLSYFAVDVDRLLKHKPSLCKSILQEVLGLLQSKKLDSHPFTEFPVSKVNDAFRYLTQARHIGKVVVTMKEREIKISPPERVSFKREAAYIVVGGCSGFGIQVAKWMGENGCSSLYLMSRSGVRSEDDRNLIDQMRAQGIKVEVVQGDVANFNDVQCLVTSIEQANVPLKGIIHSAMVLDDGMIESMDYQRFIKVIRPKVMGAWNLHFATKQKNLDFFVLFSSVSALYGNPGQANYAAANAFLDMFSHYRKQNGLAGLTVNWGVLGGAGFVARTKEVHDILENQGWKPFFLAQSLSILEQLVIENPILRGAIKADWNMVKRTFPHSAKSLRFASLYGSKEKAMASPGGPKNLSQVLNSTGKQDREAILTSELQNVVASIMGTAEGKVNTAISITNLGLDSLMANQLRSFIHNALNIDYSLMKIMQGPSITELCEQLLYELDFKESDIKNKASELDKWIIRENQNQNAKFRVFCFPYLGGDASVYSKWAQGPLKDAEICFIELPGRGQRLDEKPIEDKRELTDKLCGVIDSLSDKPYAFYGHSFGGGLCVELAQEIQRRRIKTPTHIFVGASAAPHTKNPLFDVLKDIKPKKGNDIPEEKVADLLSLIGMKKSLFSDKNWLKTTMPAIRSDIMLMLNRNITREQKFAYPITVFGGKADPAYTNDGFFRGWDSYTSKFTLRMIEGSHFFFNENSKIILEHISESMAHV